MGQTQYIGKAALAKKLGVTTRHSFVAGPWLQIEAAVERGEEHGEIDVAGKKVPWAKRSGHPSIPLSALDAFKALAEARPTAEENYLNRGDLASELGVYKTHKVIAAAWLRMTEQMDAGIDAGSIEIGGREVPWRSFYSARNLKFPFVAKSSIEAFRAVLDKIPPKATDDELSFSRVAELLGVAYNHVMMADYIDEIAEQVERGASSGEIIVGGEPVSWSMRKAIWGGSSRWGGAMPHVSATSVQLFEKELASQGRAHGAARTAAGLRYADLRSSDNAEGRELEFEVENEVEVGLIATRGGRERQLTVYAVPTANDNLLFEVLGVRHVVTVDGRVLQRVDDGGRVGWVQSPFLSIDPDFEFERKAAPAPIFRKP